MLTIAYFIIVILLIYPIRVYMDKTAFNNSDDPFELVLSIFLASIFSLFWPLMILIVLGYNLSKFIYNAVFNKEEEHNDRSKQH